MKKRSAKLATPKAKTSNIVIPQHVSFSFTCRFDMEEVTRLLSIQQTQALFRGIADILSMKNN